MMTTQHGTHPGRFSAGAKRAFDVVAASMALIVLSPVLLVVAAALLVTQGRPILFRQVRPGLHEAPFTILKFRTMRAPRGDEIWYRTDAERVTRLGRFLRRSSLDELPELWNVIRGDMSLVGPRPLLMEYLSAYTPSQRLRHHVQPGMTSWAAVNGRHVLGFDERLELDIWYVEQRSFRLDIKILLLTVGQVVRGRGVVTTQDPTAVGFPLPDTPGARVDPTVTPSETTPQAP